MNSLFPLPFPVAVQRWLLQQFSTDNSTVRWNVSVKYSTTSRSSRPYAHERELAYWLSICRPHLTATKQSVCFSGPPKSRRRQNSRDSLQDEELSTRKTWARRPPRDTPPCSLDATWCPWSCLWASCSEVRSGRASSSCSLTEKYSFIWSSG